MFIKYLLILSFAVPCLVTAQEKESAIEEQGINTGFIQNVPSESKSLKEIYPDASEIKMLNEFVSPSVIKENYDAIPRVKKEESVFNILSASYRNNIKFGGFWENYAIVNFTPSVYLKPFSFLSVYANHRHTCFIPMEGLKDHIKSLFIQGAAILAVDNSIRLLFGSGEAVPSIISFAVKTIILNSVMSGINRNRKYKIQDYESYHYAVSIRF
jgi:hypothetical protein